MCTRNYYPQLTPVFFVKISHLIFSAIASSWVWIWTRVGRSIKQRKRAGFATGRLVEKLCHSERCTEHFSPFEMQRQIFARFDWPRVFPTICYNNIEIVGRIGIKGLFSRFGNAGNCSADVELFVGGKIEAGRRRLFFLGRVRGAGAFRTRMGDLFRVNPFTNHRRLHKRTTWLDFLLTAVQRKNLFEIR